MKKLERILVIMIAIMAMAFVASASQKRAKRADAEALVKRGIALFAEKGSDEAIRIINQRAKPFLDGDLYVFVIGPDGKIVAHAYDESRVGIPAEELYDEDGQPYGKLMLKLANEEGVWIPYRQFNPVSKKVEPKQSLVRKADGYIIGCGVYEQ